MNTIYPEWDIYKTKTQMELAFWRGECFRFPGGGYTNCWMLPPGQYVIESKALGSVSATVTTGFHLTELEEMQDSGLGSANDAQIVEWNFGRFCHLCDMRRLYVNGQRMNPDDLIGFVKSRSQHRSGQPEQS